MNENDWAENAIRYEENYNFWNSELDNRKTNNLQPLMGIIWTNVLLPQVLEESA